MLSVLMSIYYKERPEYFDQAMKSIWDNQSMKPDQIVLVEDGPLTPELYDMIKNWKQKLGEILDIVSLEKNLGTGGAKSAGLGKCKGDYIAVMDTDDISTSERFEKQVCFLEKNTDIDAVGTWISEINEEGDITRDLVRYPLEHNDLVMLFMSRDPIPHVTSMFRKTFFIKGVKYLSSVTMAEDTLLWYQALLNDCKLANIDFVGVQVRTSEDLFKRRANWKKTIGLLKFRLFHINRDLNYGIKADIYAIAYFLMSISPSFVKKLLYKLFR